MRIRDYKTELAVIVVLIVVLPSVVWILMAGLATIIGTIVVALEGDNEK